MTRPAGPGLSFFEKKHWDGRVVFPVWKGEDQDVVQAVIQALQPSEDGVPLPVAVFLSIVDTEGKDAPGAEKVQGLV